MRGWGQEGRRRMGGANDGRGGGEGGRMGSGGAGEWG